MELIKNYLKTNVGNILGLVLVTGITTFAAQFTPVLVDFCAVVADKVVIPVAE